jgi:hypothetical protein
MPSHPDRVRKNYLSNIYYYPCERYTEHIITRDGVCLFCNKRAEELYPPDWYNKTVDLSQIKQNIKDLLK